MEVDFTKYVKGGYALILEPVVTIDGNITGIDINELISFLQCNENITELALKNGCICTGGVEDLVCSPHPKNLRSLNLSGNSIDNEDALFIAASPHLQNLENLNLCGNLIDDAGVELIATSSYLKNLESLDLSDNSIGDIGIKHIDTSPYLKNLKSLSLCFNKIGDEGAEYIATSPHLKNLESLDLYFNEIDDKGAKALKSGKHSRLKLDLSFNYICDESIGALRKIEHLLEYAFKRERSQLKNIYSPRFNELRYHTDRAWESLADMSKPDKQIIYCSDEQGTLSSMLEKIDSHNKSKICIASIDVGSQFDSGHCVAFYLFPEQKKILLINPYGSGGIPQEIKPFLESKGYALYASSTIIQKDGCSCVPITSEIVRMLSTHCKAVEEYLSTQDSSHKSVNLYKFLPRKELDQLCKSFSEEINIDCGRVKRARGADYRAAHFMCSLIPLLEQERLVSMENLNTPIDYKGTAEKGHERRKRMVEEIRSFFIGSQNNTKLFHQRINELFQQSETACNKAIEKKSTSFWSEHKGNIALSFAVLSIAGAITAYILAYPMVAIALTVSAAAILMVTGIVKIREEPEDPGTEKSNISVFNHVEEKQAAYC